MCFTAEWSEKTEGQICAGHRFGKLMMMMIFASLEAVVCFYHLFYLMVNL